ncbi:sporulation integral membrane protein YtvI [Longirhabdus pacifica]|uniref:sporulation integral membrane protein YtvI n=1 Tax=Longirhabdus pacifica TaxID=2305227 RepID=UPI0010092FE3|nr:sporulation integral membrane protein YtvI [Longirhabdus pacifica]
MLSFYKKYYKTAFDIGLIVLTVFLTMWIFSLMFSIAKPVFYAFVIFMIIEPFAKFLNRKGMKKSIATAISLLVFILVLTTIILGIGAIIYTQLSALISKLQSFQLQVQLQQSLQWIQARFGELPPDVVKQITDYLSTASESIATIGTTVLNTIVTYITSFSGFVINIVIAVIITYFLSIEADYWKRIMKEKTPNTFKNAFSFLSENVIKGLVLYVKAQLKLISVTFVVILVALLILQVDNALTIAVVGGIFDVLPLLGVSTLFIPWILYLFFTGDMILAIWLTGLLSIILLTRQILEPKITGESLGVSAFTTFVFMIVSVSIFGIVGLILSPILIILLKALYDQGYLQRWIRLPEDEYDDLNRT